jgi:hypothetical protein
LVSTLRENLPIRVRLLPRRPIASIARDHADELRIRHRIAYARAVRLAILLMLATGCSGLTHVRWASRFPGSFSREASSVAVVPGGGVVVAGCSQPVNGVPSSPWVARLDTAGRELWARALDAPSCVQPYVTADRTTVVVADGVERCRHDGRGHVWALALDGRTKWTAPIVAGFGLDGRVLRVRREICKRDDLAAWQAKLRCDERHGLCHAAFTAMTVHDGWVALLGSVYAPHGPVLLGDREVAPAGSDGPLYVTVEQATGHVVASGVLPEHFLATSITAERGLTFVVGSFSGPLDLGAGTWTPRVLDAYCDSGLPHGDGVYRPPCNRGDRLRRQYAIEAVVAAFAW